MCVGVIFVLVGILVPDVINCDDDLHTCECIIIILLYSSEQIIYPPQCILLCAEG